MYMQYTFYYENSNPLLQKQDREIEKLIKLKGFSLYRDRYMGHSKDLKF